MLALLSKSRMALAVSALLGIVFIAACTSTQAPSASNVVNPVSVGVSPAVTGSIGVETTYAALVQSMEQVDLSPMTSGRVERLVVDVGSLVSKGQLIAELTNGPVESQLQQAQASLREAEAKLASVKTALGGQQASAQAQLDAALATQEQLTNPPRPVSSPLRAPCPLPRANWTVPRSCWTCC